MNDPRYRTAGDALPPKNAPIAAMRNREGHTIPQRKRGSPRGRRPSCPNPRSHIGLVGLGTASVTQKLPPNSRLRRVKILQNRFFLPIR